MISSKHPGINFIIGEYNANIGTDLIVEYIDRAIPTLAWTELVFSLEKLFAWQHPPEGIQKVVCYELGKVKEVNKFENGTEARLSKLEKGRYSLNVGIDSIEVYVLKEIILSY